MLTLQNLKSVCKELGIHDDKHILRRLARAVHLYYSDKVNILHRKQGLILATVKSQYRDGQYTVTIHQNSHKSYCYCTCPDWMENSGDEDYPDVDFWCKHALAVSLYALEYCKL